MRPPLAVTRNLYAILANKAIRGVRAWIAGGPYITTVEDHGTTARVRATSKDDWSASRR